MGSMLKSTAHAARIATSHYSQFAPFSSVAFFGAASQATLRIGHLAAI